MTVVADLFVLQETDLALEQRLTALEEIRARGAEHEEAAGLRAQVVEQSAVVAALLPEQRDLDLRLASQRDHRTATETKLYGGTVRNPKELQDLQSDLDQATRLVESLEEQSLLHLGRVEEAQTALRSLEARLGTIEREWQAESERLRVEEARLEREVEGYRTRREGQAARIAAEPRLLYDRLRRRRKGIAVSLVRGGVCQGCRLTVPASLLNRARSGASSPPAQCPSCERILYII